jgi:uncharacterized protein (TIGR02217 family)
MAFIETPRFPDNISYGSTGGPAYNTTLTIVDSGWEYANINWENSRHQFNAAMGVRSMSELSDLVKFFHICRGRAHSFRYKNWLDYKSCDVVDTISPIDQVFGIGDGSTTTFQLKKTYNLYGLVELSNSKDIRKPVANTILISKNSSVLLENTDYVVDYASGLVSFTVPPTLDDVLAWGGEFDLPCRFDVDTLALSIDFYEHGSTAVPIVEVRI